MFHFCPAFQDGGHVFRSSSGVVQALQGVKLHMIKLTAPDESMVELLHDEGHPTEAPERNRLCDRGIRHMAFTVADVEALRWTAQGGGGDAATGVAAGAGARADGGRARFRAYTASFWQRAMYSASGAAGGASARSWSNATAGPSCCVVSSSR